VVVLVVLAVAARMEGGVGWREDCTGKRGWGLGWKRREVVISIKEGGRGERIIDKEKKKQGKNIGRERKNVG